VALLLLEVFCSGTYQPAPPNPHLPIRDFHLTTTSSYDTGTISGILAMPYWATTFSTGYRDSNGQLNVTSSQSSAIVSILSAGTFFGALGAAPMGDIIGRRWGLIASNGVFVLGVILQTIATSIPPFLAGRFFAGLGVGLISALGT
jgi:MFS family permease